MICALPNIKKEQDGAPPFSVFEVIGLMLLLSIVHCVCKPINAIICVNGDIGTVLVV
jgi:hypothetical protein